MDLENMRSKRTQSQKTTYCVIPFLMDIGKSIETESILVDEKRGEVTTNQKIKYRLHCRIRNSMMVAQPCEYTIND